MSTEQKQNIHDRLTPSSTPTKQSYTDASTAPIANNRTQKNRGTHKKEVKKKQQAAVPKRYTEYLLPPGTRGDTARRERNRSGTGMTASDEKQPKAPIGCIHAFDFHLKRLGELILKVAERLSLF